MRGSDLRQWRFDSDSDSRFSCSRCEFEKESIQCKKKKGTFMSKANSPRFQCLKVNVSREQKNGYPPL